jgi:hypothetical protein
MVPFQNHAWRKAPAYRPFGGQARLQEPFGGQARLQEPFGGQA